MLFRDYHSSDKETLIELFNKFQDYIVSIDPLHKVRRLPDYGKVYLEKTLNKVADHNGKFIIAELDSKIVGFVVGTVKVRSGDNLLEEYPSTYGEVVELYVDTAYRSQSIGSQLMKAIQAYFSEQKCDAVFIEVFAPNEKARAFYKKHGYGVRDLFLLKDL